MFHWYIIILPGVPETWRVKISVSAKQKSVGTYQSLVPRIEAFALPCIVERATSKPTPICIHFSLYGYKTYRLDAISHTSKGM